MKNSADRDIRIGIIGIGSMGRGLLYQSTITTGVNCIAVCDTKVERCTSALDWLGMPYKVIDRRNAMEDAVRQGLVAVCEQGEWVSRCEAIDAVVEASSAIGPAAQHAMSTLDNGKHLIMINSEIDLIFGPLLAHHAMRNEVVATSCDGDQYGVIKHLIDDCLLWGFKLVMVGNIKGYLDKYANPTTIVAEADKRNLDYHMCTSYTDGSKLNIEMAIIANACGLTTKKAGMHGPRADHVKDVLKNYDFHSLWTDQKPFVDYVIAAEPGGGVFAVGYCDNPYQMQMLSYYKMGEGPFYLFYRPYHLCHIEAMSTVINAVRYGHCFLHPEWGFQTNVYAYAKRDLKEGESLDGIGGYTCYGMIENVVENDRVPGLPICLADKVMLKRSVSRDERIIMSDVQYDPLRLDFRLYHEALTYTRAGLEIEKVKE